MKKASRKSDKSGIEELEKKNQKLVHQRNRLTEGNLNLLEYAETIQAQRKKLKDANSKLVEQNKTITWQQDQLAESQGRLIQNLISIYKSLGGGWGKEITNYELRITN